jgi:hypothetical protein
MIAPRRIDNTYVQDYINLVDSIQTTFSHSVVVPANAKRMQLRLCWGNPSASHGDIYFANAAIYRKRLDRRQAEGGWHQERVDHVGWRVERADGRTRRRQED